MSDSEISVDAKSSRREAVWILGIWTFFAVWVLSFAKWKAYPADPASMTLTFGFPSWVVWGIALPWALATVVTIWFCISVMKDR